MEHPVKEIPLVIRSLCEGSPYEQQRTLETCFLPSASFTHPICRVPGFSNYTLPLIGGEIDSRWMVWMIYRWYKILSPTIHAHIHSAVLDQKTSTLYVSMSQSFNMFFFPKWFWNPEVSLVTVLSLVHDTETNKYWIQSQQDMYQSNEFVKFLGPVLNLLVIFWQLFGTFMSIGMALVLTPVTMVEQKVAEKKLKNGSS